MNQDNHVMLTKVMDLLPDTIFMVDPQGHFIFVSGACERLLGWTQAELIARNMIDLVHPEDRARTLAAADEIMGGELKMHFQNRYLHKDGRIVHIMWSARWSKDDGLRLAVARDITELKRAERMQRAIYRISEAAHDAEHLSDLYPHVHRIIGELLPAENFFVVLFEPDGDSLSFPYFVDGREGNPGLQPLGAHPRIAEVIRTGKPLLAPAAGDHPDWLGVPLMARSGVMGALVLRTYAEGGHYTDEDRELLQFVSTQVANAIERKQAESLLHHLAHHDTLTDLPNRTLFNDRFEMALRRAQRFGERLALLVLDLDLFKEINDTLGHAVGDQVMRQVSRRLERALRKMDTVGRIGGDEFTVLLTDIHGPDDVALIVEKILAVLVRRLEVGGRSLAVSASIGSALYPEHGESIDQLFNHADAGMYAENKRRVAS